MDWYLQLLQEYGYPAIFLGTLVEGELFLALGGVLAQQGKMNMWLVAAMAVFGSFTSHTLFYFLGRWRGPALVRRFPRLQANYPRAQALAQRFGPPCIFIVQYLYGMRLVTCLTLGTLGMGLGVFLFWQIVSCTVWAVGISVGGFVFGTVIEYLVGRFGVALILVLGLSLLVFLGLWWYYRKGAPLAPQDSLLPQPVALLSASPSLSTLRPRSKTSSRLVDDGPDSPASCPPLSRPE